MTKNMSGMGYLYSHDYLRPQTLVLLLPADFAFRVCTTGCVNECGVEVDGEGGRDSLETEFCPMLVQPVRTHLLFCLLFI